MVRMVRVLADPLTLGKSPPRFAPLNNGENQPAGREGSRQDEVALGVEDTGPPATTGENNNEPMLVLSSTLNDCRFCALSSSLVLCLFLIFF